MIDLVNAARDHRPSRASVILAAFVIVVLGACGGSGPDGGATSAPTSPQGSQTPPDAAETPAASEAAATFDAISIKGRGDKVAEFKIPESAPAIAAFTHKGASNFVVTSLGTDGSENDLLVNEIGSYKGTRLFDTDSHSVAFKIEADGAWTVGIKPIASARPWDLKAALAGTGDDVIRVTGSVDDLASSVVKHTGKSNFAVVAYSTDGRELLINEIGNYSGEVLMPVGLVVLEITADGKWSVTVPK